MKTVRISLSFCICLALIISSFSCSRGDLSDDVTNFMFNEDLTAPDTSSFILFEDFETGDLSSNAWIRENYPIWRIDSTEHHSGGYSIKSGEITDNEETILSINLYIDAPSVLRFYYRVSSDSTHDYLQFIGNGSILDEWSGELNWNWISYSLTPGSGPGDGFFYLSWKYIKNSSTSAGSDCAWLDDITIEKN